MNLNNLTTEKSNARSANIDEKSSIDILRIINEEDKRVADCVERELESIAKAVDIITYALDNGGRLVYMGAGTSGRLGVLDASECPPTFNTPKELIVGLIAGGDTALRNAMEGVEDKTERGAEDLESISFNKNDVLVGIAASGRTPYVIGGIEYARDKGAKTIAVSCNQGSQISKHADVAIEVIVGPEIITGSTRMKSGTAQKMVLNMLTTASMINLGKTYKNYMIDVKPQNEKLRERSINMLMELDGIGYDKAEELLIKSGWNVKVALVMAKSNLDSIDAKSALDRYKGRVHNTISALSGEVN